MPTHKHIWLKSHNSCTFPKYEVRVGSRTLLWVLFVLSLVLFFPSSLLTQELCYKLKHQVTKWCTLSP